MVSEWLLGTTADNTPRLALTTVQKNRLKRKKYQKHKKNAIIQARKKGKPVGRAIITFEKARKLKKRRAAL